MSEKEKRIFSDRSRWENIILGSIFLGIGLISGGFLFLIIPLIIGLGGGLLGAEKESLIISFFHVSAVIFLICTGLKFIFKGGFKKNIETIIIIINILISGWFIYAILGLFFIP